jgi:dTDP-4-dehydrorhamnose reductase
MDLARAILKIIQDDSVSYGIYHFTNEGVTSWYEFARAIYNRGKKLGLIEDNKKVEIQPIKTEDYPTAARRPKYSVLSKEKIEKEFNIKIPYWRESLEKCLKRILDEGYRI